MIERFRTALGAEAVRSVEAPDPRFEAAAVIVAPADAGQAAAVLRLCAENGWIALPAGGGTWLHGGVRARRANVLISTERLRGIAEYEPADLVVAVNAGTTLAELDTAVGAHDQFFAVRPPATAATTVGGVLATASAGPLRLGYGTPRDHVLGLRMVTGDGRVLDLGGRVMKNVAGYDLVRLMVGSLGSLGLITRAFLRLQSRPLRDITVLFSGGLDALEHTARTLSDTWPVAAELIGPDTAGRLLTPGSARTGTDGTRQQWVLALRWHGNASFADHVLDRVAGDTPAPDVLEPSAAQAFWQGLAGLEAEAARGFRIVLPRDRLRSGIAAVGRILDIHIEGSANTLGEGGGSTWHVACHAGSGIARAWSADPAGTGPGLLRDRLEAVRRDLSGTGSVRAFGPPGVFAPPPRARRAGEDPAGTGAGPRHALGEAGTVQGNIESVNDLSAQRTALLRDGIRRVFDPARILAPEPAGAAP